MLGKTVENFVNLRAPVRSLVLLFWVYSFTGALIGVFTQIFLYQRFANVTLNVYAMMVFFTGIMVGFVWLGYLASRFRVNIKHGFMSSFLVTGSSIILLLYSTTIEITYVAMFLYGIGQGLFWLTIHTFELSETKNEERDFYSSLLSAGGQISDLAGPALATLFIWTSESVLEWDTFTLLFILTPLFYLLGYFCFRNITDYYPEPVTWADVKHFFSEKRNRIAQVYLLGDSVGVIASDVIPPLAILLILGGAVEVGIYNTLFALFSVFCILTLARYRTVNNRLRIFGIASLLIATVSVLLGYFFGFVMLIIYTVTTGILRPILRVSQHVIDLETMESIGRPTSDFYATMLLRDFSLFVWRVGGGVLFLFFLQYATSEKQLFFVGFSYMALTLVLAFVGAYFLIKTRPTRQDLRELEA